MVQCGSCRGEKICALVDKNNKSLFRLGRIKEHVEQSVKYFQGSFLGFFFGLGLVALYASILCLFMKKCQRFCSLPASNKYIKLGINGLIDF